MSKQEKLSEIIFVEFDANGHPFTIATYNGRSTDYYDADYSKRDDRVYCSLSGGENGASVYVAHDENTYWVEDFVTVKETTAKRRKTLPRRYSKRILRELLVDDIHTVYCSVCDDRLPDDVEVNPCPHIWWCSKDGQWSDPDERCEHGCNGWCQQEA